MPPLMKVEGLTKRYPGARFRGPRQSVLALDAVSLSILPGATLALVGESGSGKTSLALCLACLDRPTSGSIWFDGRDLTTLDEAQQRAIRPQVQMVFQDPVNSFNPRWPVWELLVEPLTIQRRMSERECRDQAAILLERVGLSLAFAIRRPHELSGGQRQRIAIGRALALEPKLIILDEALSGLDCSVQAQLANFLVALQSSLGLTYLLISHDLLMAAHLANEIAVIHRGRIVEQGATEKVLHGPQHEVTKALVSSTPRFNPAARTPRDP